MYAESLKKTKTVGKEIRLMVTRGRRWGKEELEESGQRYKLPIMRPVSIRAVIYNMRITANTAV